MFHCLLIETFQAFLNSRVLHARTQVNVLPTVVLEAQSSLELVDLITNKCVPFGKTASTAGTYRKQMQPGLNLGDVNYSLDACTHKI